MARLPEVHLTEAEKKRVRELLKGYAIGGLPHPEMRIAAFKAYLAHISAGLSERSFTYTSPCGGYKVTGYTMDRYTDRHPEECPEHLKKFAQAEGLAKWEKMGIQMMKGEIKKGNANLYRLFMLYRFGWGREEESETTETETEARKLWREWENSAEGKQRLLREQRDDKIKTCDDEKEDGQDAESV